MSKTKFEEFDERVNELRDVASRRFGKAAAARSGCGFRARLTRRPDSEPRATGPIAATAATDATSAVVTSSLGDSFAFRAAK